MAAKLGLLSKGRQKNKKYVRRTVGYTWTDYKTNTQITKELKITSILEKLLECKRNCIQHVITQGNEIIFSK
jgi:hypothetical protein